MPITTGAGNSPMDCISILCSQFSMPLSRMVAGRRKTKKAAKANTNANNSRVIHLTSASDYRKIDSLIKKGPRVMMLIYSTSCPHCVSYMPIWKKLCKVKDKKVHMVSMEHSVYSETPLASKKSVSGVPTVIYVDPKGEIHEEDNIRDETVMTNAITNLPLTLTSSVSSSSPSSSPSSASSFPSSSPSSAPSPSIEEPVMLRTSEITDEDVPVKSVKERAATPYPARNTNSESNSLPPLPATPIFTEPMSGGYREEQQRVSQTGGDPWSAFLSVARQAAPAAALLAAYGMLPLKRASGLHAARKTKRTNRSNRSNR